MEVLLESFARWSWTEALTTVLLIVAVWLVTRQSLWNYPLGIAGVVLYGWSAYSAQLYMEAGLQVYYVGMQIWGWWHWARGGAGGEELKVSRLSHRERLLWLLGVGGAIAAVAALLAAYTDQNRPLIDTTTTLVSLLAQFLSARKKLETWILWLFVNVLYVYLWWSLGSPAYTLLYLVFLGLATVGLVSWWRSWRRDRSSHPSPVENDGLRP